MTNITVNAEMKMQEVRAIAKQVGVKFRAGMTKLDLITLIEEAIEFDREEQVIEIEEVVAEEENEKMFAVEASMDEVTEENATQVMEENAPVEEVKEEEAGSVEDQVEEKAAKKTEKKKEEKKAPVKKEQEGINLFFGGIKGSEEYQHEMLYKKIGELKVDLEANFTDIEYLTSWIMGIKEKNGVKVLAIKLKNVFSENHLEIVEKHGFELNRAHFYTYLPLPEVKEEKKVKNYNLIKKSNFKAVKGIAQ